MTRVMVAVAKCIMSPVAQTTTVTLVAAEAAVVVLEPALEIG